MFSGRWSASSVALLLFVSAAASASPGLDVALLIDRSTSMAHRSRNQDVLLRMTLDLLARNAEANRVEHRIAVISFGSSARVDVPFTSVHGGETRLRRQLATLHYEDLGDTNVLDAFVAAERLFRVLPANPERLRAIVLLTDGVPFVRGVNSKAYRASLRIFATTHLAREGISIDVLLVDSRNTAMWSELARVTLAGSAPDQFLPQTHGVIARLAGTRTAESAPAKTNPAIDTLVVPPYLEVIVFDIFRASRNAAVEIFPPRSTRPIRAGINGITSLPVGDVLATFVVPRPVPGEWIIRKSRADTRVRVLSQQFFPRGVLLRPAETETLSRCSRVPLAYRVLDGRGDPLEELPDYALTLEVTLAKPDGANSTIAMERDASLGAAGFRSAHDMLCEIAGRYWTDVRITALDAKGHRLEVFRDRWSGFSVAPTGCAQPPIRKKTGS
jgi:von Willebrand factor type A domain